MNKASRWGYSAVVRQLIIHGVDVHWATEDGWTPVLGAAEMGYADTIVELSRGGAVPHDRSQVMNCWGQHAVCLCAVLTACCLALFAVRQLSPAASTGVGP